MLNRMVLFTKCKLSAPNCPAISVQITKVNMTRKTSHTQKRKQPVKFQNCSYLVLRLKRILCQRTCLQWRFQRDDNKIFSTEEISAVKKNWLACKRARVQYDRTFFCGRFCLCIMLMNDVQVTDKAFSISETYHDVPCMKL